MLSSSFNSGPMVDSDANNEELLLEIEEISKALYLDHKTNESSLICSSDLVQPNLINRSHFGDLKSNPKVGFDEDDEKKKPSKPSSIWGWKKPLKALSHIRSRKFSCCFFCHVHCVENFPLEFEGVSVSVHWKKKDNVFKTHPVRVSNGRVEFEETLMSKCTVYGLKNGPGNFVKYEPKNMLLYTSVVGALGLDIGKNWVDLTRLLPVTMEELEQENCSGRWFTSFKLSGKAKGATLHVSFAFLVINDGLCELGSDTNNGVNRLSFVGDFEPVRGDVMLKRVGSVPSNLTRHPSLDILDFSNSVNMICGMLEERTAENPAKDIDVVLEELESLRLGPMSSFSGSREDFGRGKYEGIELEENPDKEIILDESAAISDLDVSVVEVIDVAEIFEDEGVLLDGDIKSNMMVDESSVQMEDSNSDVEVFLNLCEMSISEPNPSVNKTSGENEAKCKGSKLVKSLSLDDVTKAVADDFFKLLQGNRSPSTVSSINDLESPRERLLRQFEEDMTTSGGLFFGDEGPEKFNGKWPEEQEDEEFDYPAPSISSSEFTFTAGIDLSHKSASKSKMKATSLEQLETESLMQKWGLNEESFESSPCNNNSTGGFGSPIYVPREEPIGLPPLGEGLGPLLYLKDGGLLRSMSLKNMEKCGEGLVMQASKVVVLPAELGSDIMATLQHIASIGVNRLIEKIHKLMPLEEISGRIIQQLAWETLSKAESTSKRSVDSFEHLSDLQDLALLALNAMEVMVIEGLRIQSGMSDQKTPSIIKVKSRSEITSRNTIVYSNKPSDLLDVGECSDFVEGLLDLSISLDDWLSLDAGRFDDKNSDLRTEKCKFGIMGDSLILALMIQLRDPVRNYEPVGAPMLGLIQVQRVPNDSSEQDEGQMEEGNSSNKNYGPDELPMFRVNEVHVAGLNIGYGNSEIWASKRQQQSGSRWLLATGLSKTRNCHISESRLITRRPILVPRNVMWSVARHFLGLVDDPSQFSVTRNPDIIFPGETM